VVCREIELMQMHALRYALERSGATQRRQVNRFTAPSIDQFELVINIKAAKALVGARISDNLLSIADE
jgi:hypothetical protein